MSKVINGVEIFEESDGLIIKGAFVGAPVTTAGVFAIGCEILGADGKAYRNAGTTASPVWQDTDSISTSEIADLAITTGKIAASAVTYAKVQNVSATDRLLGRKSTGAGVVEEITVGGDISQVGSTFTIGANAVTFAKLATLVQPSHVMKFFVLGSSITGTTLTGLLVNDYIVTIKADGTVTVETCAVADTLPSDPADTSYILVFRTTV